MRAIRRQNGAALLIMVMIIGVAVTAWMLSLYGAGLTNTRTTSDRDHNAKVLNLAKQALIGYVAQQASTDNYPGRLPCPEPDGNISSNPGVAVGTCTLPAVGRLPWKTLGIDQLLDAAGEPLWYVVSPGWSYNGVATFAINSNTPGQLVVNNESGGNAALIIAPGRALTVSTSANCTSRVQVRAAPAPGMNFRDYLECQNASGTTTFAGTGPSGSFNDQVLAVSPRDLWSIVEAAVAERMIREIISPLKAVFQAPYTDSTQWGSGISPSSPLLPFALSFAGTSNPVKGKLPLWRSQGCTAGTDPYCDPNFVTWKTAGPGPSVVQRNPGSNSSNLTGATTCAASSTAQEVVCTVSYSRQCGGFLNLGYILGGTCSMDMEVSILAEAQNVGRALRSFSTVGISVDATPWSIVSSATPIDVGGSAAADIRLQLPRASCSMPIIFGLLFPCTASRNVTVRIPITVFPDHPALTAFFACADCGWFIDNHWSDLMYYAVAPSHTPQSVNHDCRTASTPDCLTVSGGTFIPSNSGIRALVGITGYSLSGLSRPNTNIGDYLDSSLNQDPVATSFEQRVASRAFNDRFFAISYY